MFSTKSQVFWTKDANLLGSLYASQGFDTVVENIVKASSGITYGTPPTDKLGRPIPHTITKSDFSIDGTATWHGSMAFINYLNSIRYGGGNQWYLPTVANKTTGYNTSDNGKVKGDELVELFYSELRGTANNDIPDTDYFTNEQLSRYWSGTELDKSNAWAFRTETGYQSSRFKSQYKYYVWAVHPESLINAAPVPEPESVAMLLLGLGVVAGMARRRRG